MCALIAVQFSKCNGQKRKHYCRILRIAIYGEGNVKKRRQLSMWGFHPESCFWVFDYAVGRVAVKVVPSSSLLFAGYRAAMLFCDFFRDGKSQAEAACALPSVSCLVGAVEAVEHVL